MIEVKRLLSSYLGSLGSKAVYLIGAFFTFGILVMSSFTQSPFQLSLAQPSLESKFLAAADLGREVTSTRSPSSLAAPTPASGAMSVYVITNPNDASITVQHTIVDNANGQPYYFWSEIPARSAVEVHTRDVVQLPEGFSGMAKLSAVSPFLAEIVGYDYPDPGIIVGQDPTPTPGGTYKMFFPRIFAE